MNPLNAAIREFFAHYQPTREAPTTTALAALKIATDRLRRECEGLLESALQIFDVTLEDELPCSDGAEAELNPSNASEELYRFRQMAFEGSEEWPGPLDIDPRVFIVFDTQRREVIVGVGINTSDETFQKGVGDRYASSFTRAGLRGRAQH